MIFWNKLASAALQTFNGIFGNYFFVVETTKLFATKSIPDYVSGFVRRLLRITSIFYAQIRDLAIQKTIESIFLG